ncbi:ribosome biogenesis protein TSR3, putative [Plasmodium gallinaceum]|uniref:18S rRNA aminocarboxypropyltransferase n=1 Tax=Plasmodium gallinaceum TaxID=5849 RepID=A0A1J1GZZ7_PLAGA|nr:ribosome biogenesis protein TSR3, putative [Plasmodium gallinaceum]CRG97769.1 ribosome biogenesis protein TSR3, putative [Plasmodium gallinaceum]
MKKSYLERKKYSVHNLIKIINERKREKERNNENIESTKKKLEDENSKICNKIEKKKEKKEKEELNLDNMKKVDSSSQSIIEFDERNGCTREINDKKKPNYENDISDDKDEFTNESNDEENQCTSEYSDNIKKDIDEIKLFMIDYKECQNKKCSCKKLYRFKKIKKVQTNKKFKGIVLTPFCEKYFSINDKYTVEKFGLSVIDCSWKSLDLLKKIKYSNQRKLPYIIAVNSINYGKPYKLSCLESLAFCLYICNYTQQCNDILNIYKWSINFTNLNKELLDKYKLCKNHDEIKKAESEFIENYLDEKEENKKIDQYKVIYEDNYI